MEWYMWIVTFTVGSFFANILLRWLYGKKLYFYEEFLERGYRQGYRDGAVNVKMYYSITTELPSLQWIKENQGKLLDTREKLVASISGKN
jgi:hypothetical protein